jgi:flagellar hook-basal body complex protein FliE
MSDIDINQVLAQMRVMAAAAERRPVSAPQPAEKADFGEILKDSINQVNEAQSQAKDLVKAFEAGDKNVELPEVMVALQKASISFEAMTQVRNKLLSAYQEIMNMQV